MEELFAIWKDTERDWIKKEWSSSELQADILKYLNLQSALSKTSGPDARGKIMKEASRVAQGTHLRVME